MHLFIPTKFIKDDSKEGLLNFAKWTLDNHKEVDSVSFDSFWDLDTFDRNNIELK